MKVLRMWLNFWVRGSEVERWQASRMRVVTFGRRSEVSVLSMPGEMSVARIGMLEVGVPGLGFGRKRVVRAMGRGPVPVPRSRTEMGIEELVAEALGLAV